MKTLILTYGLPDTIFNSQSHAY